MNYKARFYSPALGRFIQPDSIIPDQSNPQSWNRFSYVSNNPIRFNDLTGHMMWDGDEGGVAECTDPIDCTDGQPNPPSGDLDLLLGLHPNSCTANASCLGPNPEPPITLQPASSDPSDLLTLFPESASCTNQANYCTEPSDLSILDMEINTTTYLEDRVTDVAIGLSIGATITRFFPIKFRYPATVMALFFGDDIADIPGTTEGDITISVTAKNSSTFPCYGYTVNRVSHLVTIIRDGTVIYQGQYLEGYCSQRQIPQEPKW